MRFLQFTFVAVIVGVLVLGFVFVSIPFSDAIRWVLSGSVWVLGTIGIVIVARRLQSLPPKLRPLTCIALSGWTFACVVAAILASHWLALDLFFNHNVLTPEAWIWCRAVLVGLALAIVPAMFVFWFSGRFHNGGCLTNGST